MVTRTIASYCNICNIQVGGGGGGTFVIFGLVCVAKGLKPSPYLRTTNMKNDLLIVSKAQIKKWHPIRAASLQIIFVCRKVICQARASFDWTRTQSGWTKNSKQNEEIKFQREW